MGQPADRSDRTKWGVKRGPTIGHISQNVPWFTLFREVGGDGTPRPWRRHRAYKDAQTRDEALEVLNSTRAARMGHVEYRAAAPVKRSYDRPQGQ